MVDANNNHESLHMTDVERDHLHLQMLRLGNCPLLLVGAAALGGLFLFGGSLYLVVHWLGWWR